MLRTYGCFLKWWYPQSSSIFNGIFQYKTSHLGVPPFMKSPTYPFMIIHSQKLDRKPTANLNALDVLAWHRSRLRLEASKWPCKMNGDERWSGNLCWHPMVCAKSAKVRGQLGAPIQGAFQTDCEGLVKNRFGTCSQSSRIWKQFRVFRICRVFLTRWLQNMPMDLSIVKNPGFCITLEWFGVVVFLPPRKLTLAGGQRTPYSPIDGDAPDPWEKKRLRVTTKRRTLPAARVGDNVQYPNCKNISHIKSKRTCI